MNILLNPRSCVIDYNAEGVNVKLQVIDSPAEDDELYANYTNGMSSFLHCLGTEFTSELAKPLRIVLAIEYYKWFNIYLFLMIALACISQSQGFINALSSTVGLILVNGTAFVTIAILAATKRLKALRYICEWFVFCSQILFAYGSDTSPGFASVAKCAAQMFGMSFMYLFICFDDDFKLASSPVIVLSVFVSISGVFFLHTYVPYESALSIYAAIMYALGWSAYIIHEGYKKVLVRKV